MKYLIFCSSLILLGCSSTEPQALDMDMQAKQYQMHHKYLNNYQTERYYEKFSPKSVVEPYKIIDKK